MIGENLNMSELPREQHKTNTVHYTQWSKRARGHVGRNGQDGAELVSAMMWAVSSGRNTKVTDAMVERRYGRLQQNRDAKQLQLLMNNWTDGQVDKTTSYEVHNGLGAWRGLYHQQLQDNNTNW